MEITTDELTVERQRMLAENRRRTAEVDWDRYAPWDAAEILTRDERKRRAARMLRDIDAFPLQGDECLEVGFGSLGWLPDLISWGLREPDLYGIELDPIRAKVAMQSLPLANLLVGNA